MQTESSQQHRTILEAAQEGDVDVVNAILNTNPGAIYAQDEHGNTALHIAAMEGHLNILKVCVASAEQGDIEEVLHWRNNYQQTPACLAASLGETDVLTYCIEQDKSTLTDHDQTGNTPLFAAIEQNQPDGVRACLVADPTLWRTPNTTQRLPTLFAFECGSNDCLEAMQDLEPELMNNATLWSTECGQKEYPLIHVAIDQNSLKLFQYCVSLDRENINQLTCKRGDSAVMHAARRGRTQMLAECLRVDEKALQRQNSRGTTAFLESSLHLDTVQLCLQHDKTLIDQRNVYSRSSILHYAAEWGSLDVFKYLVELYPTLLHEQAFGGSTPMFDAAMNHHIDIVQYCIATDISTLNQRNIAITCVLHKNHRLLDIVLRAKSELSRQRRSGSTPAYIATCNEDYVSLCILLEHDPQMLMVMPEQRRRILDKLIFLKVDFAATFRPLLQSCFANLRRQYPNIRLAEKAEQQLIDDYLNRLKADDASLCSLANLIGFLKNPNDQAAQERVLQSDKQALKNIGIALLVAGGLMLCITATVTLTPAGFLIATHGLNTLQAALNAHLVAATTLSLVSFGLGALLFSQSNVSTLESAANTIENEVIAALVK